MQVEGVRHDHVTAGGVRFHVAEAGAGVPVVLLHGFPQHWYAWRRVVPLLAGEFRLIMPDARGAGGSDAPRKGYDTATRARDVLALMDAMDLDRVRLIGHEWGAWAGFRACLDAPDRFEGFLALNMVHPWPYHRNLLKGAWRMWYTALWEYPVLGAAVLRHWPAFTRFMLRDSGDPDAIEEFVQAVREPARARAGQALHWQYVTKDIPRLIVRRKERLRVPTRILFGDHDFAASPDVLPGGERHADDLRTTVVAGGHYLPERQPALVAGAARELFAPRAALETR